MLETMMQDTAMTGHGQECSWPVWQGLRLGIDLVIAMTDFIMAEAHTAGEADCRHVKI